MNESGYTRFGSIGISDAGSDGEASEPSDDERPTKKARTVTGVPPQASPTPKWSNPDFYTALPPEDAATGTGPKKDIIGLIRKSKKVDSLPQTAAVNAVANNVDFISFTGDVDNSAGMNAQIVAPTGPRAMQADSSKHVTPAAHKVSISLKKLAASPPSAAVPANRVASSLLVEDEFDHPPRLQPIECNVLPTLEVKHKLYRKEAGAKRKRVDLSGKLGDIVPGWRARADRDPTPWFTPQRSNYASPHQRQVNRENCVGIRASTNQTQSSRRDSRLL